MGSYITKMEEFQSTTKKLRNVIIIAQLFTNQFSKEIFYEVIASLFTSYRLFLYMQQMKISLCARTLLDPFLIMLTLEDHTLCLEQLYSQIVIKSVYTCMAFYCYYSTHTLLGPVCCTIWLYLQTLVVHTLCLDQFHCCTFIHKSSLCSLLDCEYNCTVQLYTH